MHDLIVYAHVVPESVKFPSCLVVSEDMPPLLLLKRGDKDVKALLEKSIKLLGGENENVNVKIKKAATLGLSNQSATATSIPKHQIGTIKVL